MAVAPDLRRAAGVLPLSRRAEAQLAEDLFQAHARQIYAYCLRRLGSREEAEDALQATYLNAYRSLKGGFEPQLAQAWLLKVAQNVCFDRLRSTTRRARLELAHDAQEVEELAPAPVVGDELFGIEDALAALPDQQRRAILLREWQGLSYKEVAQELGLSQGAVETLLFRARRSLAAALEQPEARSRRRLLHAFDLGSLLTGLKASLGANLSANLATGIAVAATATTLASAPVGREMIRPLGAEPAQAQELERPTAARSEREAVRPSWDGSGFARLTKPEHGKGRGKPSWAGKRGAKKLDPPGARGKKAHADHAPRGNSSGRGHTTGGGPKKH
jgi:RNA polymerase sigma factor (sigma-70 family)